MPDDSAAARIKGVIKGVPGMEALKRALIGRAVLGLPTRLRPVSTRFGFDRGTPIDRYYIDRFLGERAPDIRGRVLEVGGSLYTERFGGGRVEAAEVLSPAPGSPAATVVGDLSDSATLPAGRMDCFICTQTFNVIFDAGKAVAGACHLLRPGGVMLATVAGLSQISRHDMDRWGDYWRFTTLSAKRLAEEAFGAGNVEVASYGNALAAASFLYGVSAEELKKEELDYNDPDYQVLITIRAVKRTEGRADDGVAG